MLSKHLTQIDRHEEVLFHLEPGGVTHALKALTDDLLVALFTPRLQKGKALGTNAKTRRCTEQGNFWGFYCCFRKRDSSDRMPDNMTHSIIPSGQFVTQTENCFLI